MTYQHMITKGKRFIKKNTKVFDNVNIS